MHCPTQPRDCRAPENGQGLHFRRPEITRNHSIASPAQYQRRCRKDAGFATRHLSKVADDAVGVGDADPDCSMLAIKPRQPECALPNPAATGRKSARLSESFGYRVLEGAIPEDLAYRVP